MIKNEHFSEINRDKVIGNSLYRICRDDNTKKWYIYEHYNDKEGWAINRAYYNSSLEDTIHIWNGIKEEREIVRLLSHS